MCRDFGCSFEGFPLVAWYSLMSRWSYLELVIYCLSFWLFTSRRSGFYLEVRKSFFISCLNFFNFWSIILYTLSSRLFSKF